MSPGETRAGRKASRTESFPAQKCQSARLRPRLLLVPETYIRPSPAPHPPTWALLRPWRLRSNLLPAWPAWPNRNPESLLVHPGLQKYSPASDPDERCPYRARQPTLARFLLHTPPRASALKRRRSIPRATSGLRDTLRPGTGRRYTCQCRGWTECWDDSVLLPRGLQSQTAANALRPWPMLPAGP